MNSTPDTTQAPDRALARGHADRAKRRLGDARSLLSREGRHPRRDAPHGGRGRSPEMNA
jgi:hypothetical protein